VLLLLAIVLWFFVVLMPTRIGRIDALSHPILMALFWGWWSLTWLGCWLLTRRPPPSLDSRNEAVWRWIARISMSLYVLMPLIWWQSMMQPNLAAWALNANLVIVLTEFTWLTLLLRRALTEPPGAA
jgi:hypothetical protein